MRKEGAGFQDSEITDKSGLVGTDFVNGFSFCLVRIDILCQNILLR